MVRQVVYHCAAASGSGSAAGLQRAERRGSRTAAAAASGTGTAGLSGLSSRCGGGSAFNAALALGLRSAMRLCCCVLPSVHACCLTHCAKQDGLRYLAFLFRRVEIAIRAFSRRWCGYLPWRVHFGFGRLFVAIPTGLPGTRGTRNGVRENGAGGAAFVRFCAIALALQFFPRGERWG